VGQEPETFALVRGTEVVRSDAIPLSIEPERGQISEYDSEPPRSEHWGIFHEDEPGSNIANDASHFGPEPGSLAAETFSRPGDADVLARESARHHVNTAAPWSAVKGSDVIPDRERRQDSIVLARKQNVSGVGFELDGADGSPPEQVPAEDASARAREEGEFS